MSDADLPEEPIDPIPADPAVPGEVASAGGTESTGLETNVAAALTYALGAVTGIIFLLIEKKDQEVRWNAGQSVALTVALIGVSIVLAIVGAIPVIGLIAWLVSLLVSLGAFVLWVFLLVRTFQGNRVTLPVVGAYAQKIADAIK